MSIKAAQASARRAFYVLLLNQAQAVLDLFLRDTEDGDVRMTEYGEYREIEHG